MNEAQTRRRLIDRALDRAGWKVGNRQQVGIEIPVDRFDPTAWQDLKATLKREGLPEHVDLPAGISDYVLYRDNGEILAVVEAKRTSIDPRLAEAQARFYVSQLEKAQSFRPFAFMTNGRKIYFLDAGMAAKREVRGFFTERDLERLLAIRRNRTSLAATAIDNSITDRPYQHEAVRRVCEAFDAGKRRTLVVMATGTGKTRVAMSIVDVFMRSKQARVVGCDYLYPLLG
jgi:type I restriction enzyme, R subunit